MEDDHSLGGWFLTTGERDNPDTELDRRRGDGRAWTTGNHAEVLVHGATYFKHLHETILSMAEGDWVHFTDWRGDPDERLDGPGSEVGQLLADAAARGVHVRGLVWRSHPDQTKFSEQENLHLARIVNEKGGEVLLDERVRRGGSHHQKLFLLRHPQDESKDVAFVGGIDICHGRNDDERHLGDEQVYSMDPRYGDRPAWHDAQMLVRGPAVGDLAWTFRERWEDPTPLDHRNPVRKLMKDRAHEPDKPGRLPPMPSDPPPAGTLAIQVLRTYPYKRPAFPFAKRGERSIARAYNKAVKRVQKLIYLEDQYLWSEDIAQALADALEATPTLHLIAVVPRYPEQDGRISGAPPRLGQGAALQRIYAAGGERVIVCDIENEMSRPIYVHAKACVMDDVWAMVGSDNLNRRSWTHDSELSCAVLDERRDDREPHDPAGLGDHARVFARNLRLKLWREHLGRHDDHGLIDPIEGFAEWRRSMEELDGWHERGRVGPRPAGRVRRHRLEPVSRWSRWWAKPVYRAFVDPDGRPRDLRRSSSF